jgi:hypothetical protein
VTTVSDETIDRILQRVATWPSVTVTRSADTPASADGTMTEAREPPTDGRGTPSDPDADRPTAPPVEGALIRVGETVVAGLRDDGLLDLPVDRRLRDHLLTEGRADRHPAVPTADRLSYRIAGPTDVTGAMWLLRVVHLAQCCREEILPRATVARRLRSLRPSPELVRLVRGDDGGDPGATDGLRSAQPHRSRD